MIPSRFVHTILMPLGWATGATAVGMACLMTPPVFFVVMARDIDVDPALVGAYAAASALAGGLASIASGAFIQRFGPVRVSQVCMACMCAGLVLVTLPSLAAVALSMLLLGAGYGPTNAYTAHVLARHTPESRRALIFSIKQAGVALGSVLAGAIVPGLVVAYGWRAASWIMAGALSAFAVASSLLRGPYDAERDPHGKLISGNFIQPLRMVIADDRLRELAMVIVTYNMLQAAYVAAIVTYLVEDIGMAITKAGTVLALANIFGVIGRIGWGWIADLTGQARRTLAILGFVMAGAAVAVAAFSPAWPYGAILLASAVLGATAIGWNGVFLAEVARAAPQGQVARTTGAAVSFGFLGGTLGPLTLSTVTTATSSYAIGYVVMGAIALAGAFVSLRPRPDAG